ncbi:Kunitz family serine protease inhibitor, partial [Actinotalea soli]|uniref:Kunitz family serine protease inhibitor n=1 Tax=Actinotalea soli TaxID=2819234 RepID=UPI001FB80E26
MLDTDGNQVRLGPNYQIEYTGSDGHTGVLGLLRNDQSQCEKFIGPTSHNEGRLVSFASGNDLSQDNVMKEGDRYVFSSIATWNHPCKSPGVWTTGKTPNGVHFKPIVAAQDPDSNDIRPRLIQVTKAGEEEG